MAFRQHPGGIVEPDPGVEHPDVSFQRQRNAEQLRRGARHPADGDEARRLVDRGEHEQLGTLGVDHPVEDRRPSGERPPRSFDASADMAKPPPVGSLTSLDPHRPQRLLLRLIEIEDPVEPGQLEHLV